MRSVSFAVGTLSSSAAFSAIIFICINEISASLPVTASIRRTPEAMLPSLAILKNADRADVVRMRTAAELFRVVDVDDAHFGAVFFSEKLLDVGMALRLFIRELVRFDLVSFADLFVDEHFDVANLFFGQRFVVVEVKAQPVGFDKRSCLADVASEYFLQCPVQKMSGCVVIGDLLAALRST